MQAQQRVATLEQRVEHATTTAHGSSRDLDEVLMEKAALVEERDRLDKELTVRAAIPTRRFGCRGRCRHRAAMR